jgi:hypothetical protein
MKSLIAKVDFTEICSFGLMLRLAAAGFSGTPHLTETVPGIYMIFVLVKLLGWLVIKIKSNIQR